MNINRETGKLEIQEDTGTSEINKKTKQKWSVKLAIMNSSCNSLGLNFYEKSRIGRLDTFD